jgi:hypothetical protein
MFSDVAAALAFLALGLDRFSRPWLVAAGVVLVGFMTCGLLEYVLHRWVLHGPPSMARRAHAHHHAEPRALISTPLFVIMTWALAIWGLLGFVLPAGVAAFLAFGLYAGYNYFAVVHHLQHIVATTSRASPICDDSSDFIELIHGQAGTSRWRTCTVRYITICVACV